jgi:hypothetical protein
MKRSFLIEVPEFPGFEFVDLRAPKEGEYLIPPDYGELSGVPFTAPCDFHKGSLKFIYKKLEPITPQELNCYPMSRLNEVTSTTAFDEKIIARSKINGLCTLSIETAKKLDTKYWIEFAVVK